MVMQKMRAGAQGLAAKVLMGLVVFVLAVTGFGAIQLFSGSEPVVASVNGDDITERALQAEVNAHRRAYEDLGQDLTEEMLDSLVDRSAVLAAMIDQALLAQAADDLGLSMADETVQARLRAEFARQGGFDEALFRNALASVGHTPTSFHAERFVHEVTGQLRRGLSDTAFLTSRELRRASEVVAQKRDIAWLTFRVPSLMDEVEVSDEEIAEHYDTYQENYVSEERFDFDLVRMPRSSLEADIEIGEEEVVAAYEAEVADAEPLRRAAHILLEVSDERSPEEAERILAGTRASILAGASFGEKAREMSEDPGTADDGGDLGPSGRGVFPAAFEEALWALAPGELSAPVRTEFGVHLIKLISEEAEDPPTLTERREEITARLRREEADRRFQSVLDDFDKFAFEEEDSLLGLAGEFGLAIEPLDGATRRTREGLLAEKAVRDALFSDEVVVEGYNSSAVATADAEALVARLRTRHPPLQRPLEEVKEAVRLTLKEFGARGLAEQRALRVLEELTRGKAPSDVSGEHGLSWERADGFRIDGQGVPLPVAELAFSMKAPGPGERNTDLARLDDGSQAIVLLTNVALADYGALPEADREQLATMFASSAGPRDLAAMLRTLRGAASIDAKDLSDQG